MSKVLITDALASSGKAVLSQVGLEVIEILDGDVEKLNSVLPEVDAWIIRSGTTITARDIKDAKLLRVIGRAGVGVDNIEIEAATEQGIVVMNTPGGNTISAAEHTVALMMSLARNIPAGDVTIKAGAWERKSLVGTEVNGKTLGVLGLGRIGQEVARRALGLQMNVIGYDPYVAQDQLQVKSINVQELDRVIEEADILTLHLPRNKDTLNLISSAELKKMKSSALLINCARGGLVNESDLALALNRGDIAGAALDVFTVEPPDDNPLLDAKNIVLTPHLGASTIEASENVAVQVASQVKEYLLHDKLKNTLNLPIKDMSILKSIGDLMKLASKIGRLQHPLHSAAIKSLRLSYNGDSEHIKPLLYAAFGGVMEGRHEGIINLINAQTVAKSKGISLSTLHDPELSHVKNVTAVTVESKAGTTWNLMGYVDVQGGHRLTKINSFHVDVLLDGFLILILNQDVPGVVGEVGTLLGNVNINIAEYSLSRSGSDIALSIIKCDSQPDPELMGKLKSISSIVECYFLG